MPELQVQRVQAAGKPCLALSGKLDFDSAPDFRKTVQQELSKHGGVLLLDLSGLELLDTGGLATLVDAHNRAQTLGVNMVLLNPSEPADEALQTSRTASLFTIARDEEEVAAVLP